MSAVANERMLQLNEMLLEYCKKMRDHIGECPQYNPKTGPRTELLAQIFKQAGCQIKAAQDELLSAQEIQKYAICELRDVYKQASDSEKKEVKVGLVCLGIFIDLE